MGDMEIPDELIDQLLGEYQGPEQLIGPDGLINQLRKRLISPISTAIVNASSSATPAIVSSSSARGSACAKGCSSRSSGSDPGVKER